MVPTTSPVPVMLVMETSASRSWVTVEAGILVLLGGVPSTYAPAAVKVAFRAVEVVAAAKGCGFTENEKAEPAPFAIEATALVQVTTVPACPQPACATRVAPAGTPAEMLIDVAGEGPAFAKLML